jgi:CubicO group peptidase (beta-lactamase class C family)
LLAWTTAPSGCRSSGGTDEAEASVTVSASDLPVAAPGDVGVATQPLIDMTRWVTAHPDVPLFSLLLSRQGTLVYELYTPTIERDDAHYLMSTTKSVTSALVGAAIDRGLISGTDATIDALLPRSLFRGDDDVARFHAVTLKDAMEMSALDANEPPHDTRPEAVARGKAFAAASNRVAFALTQNLLSAPGSSYQYNDITPMLAGGALQYATGKRLFDFGTETLFRPMGFKNAEWMNEDPTGIDLASYGLRLRPMDMQKFGILFLNHGRWGTQQLLSERWADTSWTPTMNTGPGVTPGFLNYGWYWWYRRDWGTDVHWTNGWRGQFIVCMPQLDAVFSMTADIETGDETHVLATLVTQYVVPALLHAGSSPDLDRQLATELANAHQGPSRIRPNIEPRMKPSAAPKATAIPFQPTALPGSPPR